jgi:dihydrofolate reductase
MAWPSSPIGSSALRSDAVMNPSRDMLMSKITLRLHEWAFNSQDEQNRKVREEGIADEGAVIAGRETYDTSVPWWGPDGPTGSARRPVFVVTTSSLPRVRREGSIPSSPTASKAHWSRQRPPLATRPSA